jgi:flagellar FliL protein
MSTAAAAPAASSANEAPRKKSKLVLILVVALVGAGGAGGGAWFFLKGKPADAEHAAEEPKKKAPPTFVTPDVFTVNLADRDHFLQTQIVFEVESAKTTEALNAQMPILRSRILMLLSSKTSEELSQVDGKKKLVEELLTEVRGRLPEKEQKAVEAVHFASFVIQ